MIHITVEDTGIGIAPEDQDNIFLEFRQVEEAANRRFEGTGLGLAISKRIVTLMGGNVWVESQLDVGSCFGFSIPVPAIPADTRPVPEILPAHLHRILLVSSHLISRGILERALIAAGVEVLTGAQTIAIDRALAQGQVDMIILDAEGDHLAEASLTRFLSHIPPACPLVILSSSLSTVAGQLGARGAWQVIAKPALWRDLVAAAHIVAAPASNAATDAPEAPQNARALGRPAPQDAPLSVLYAEDNATNRLVFGKMLKDLPVTLHTAVNGREAVAMVQNLRPDLIFMDVSMPEMDGREATQLIRAQSDWPQVPIIALTAHALPEEAARLQAIGITEVLTKPLRKARLIEALDRYAPRAGGWGQAGV